MSNCRRLKAKRVGIENDFLAHARDVLTRNFQKQIRESAIWPQMVAQFGEQQAEEMLKQCKGELKRGLPPDEAGYGPEDI